MLLVAIITRDATQYQIALLVVRWECVSGVPCLHLKVNLIDIQGNGSRLSEFCHQTNNMKRVVAENNQSCCCSCRPRWNVSSFGSVALHFPIRT